MTNRNRDETDDDSVPIKINNEYSLMIESKLIPFDEQLFEKYSR